MNSFIQSTAFVSYQIMDHCDKRKMYSPDILEEVVDTSVEGEEEMLVVEIFENSSVEENDESSKEKNEANKKIRKSLNKIRSLLLELLETERTYVKDLEEICYFYLPLSRNQENFLAMESQSLDRKNMKKVVKERRSLQENNLEVCLEISTKDARVMLANIEELKDYHKKVVLVKLEQAGDDSTLLKQLFTDEATKMEVKYGRYCVNKARAAEVVNNNWEFLSQFQKERDLSQRIDAHLIKPVQRLTRYHMFLTSLKEASSVLGDTAAVEDYLVAEAAVLEAANHTNTLMWIGQLSNSPLDLSRQGNLLKHGPVKVVANTGMSSSLGLAVWNMCKQSQECQLFLFKQTLLVCKVVGEALVYKWHVNVNKVIVHQQKGGTCFQLIKKIYIGKEEELNGRKERRSVVVQCSSEVEKEQWIQAIQDEISLLHTFSSLLFHPNDKL